MNSKFEDLDYLNHLQAGEHIDGVDEIYAYFLKNFTKLFTDWDEKQIIGAAARCAIFERAAIIGKK